MRQIPLWTQAGLPGRPVVETSGGLEDVSPGRIVRGKNGKVVYLGSDQSARFVAETASDYLGQNIQRVYFLRKNGEYQKQYAIAFPKGTTATKSDIVAVEVFVWIRLRQSGKAKRKRVRLTAT